MGRPFGSYRAIFLGMGAAAAAVAMRISGGAHEERGTGVVARVSGIPRLHGANSAAGAACLLTDAVDGSAESDRLQGSRLRPIYNPPRPNNYGVSLVSAQD